MTKQTASENMKEYEAAKAIMKANRYDVWNLAGDANKSARVCLMYAITGNLLPARQCGVNAIEKLLTEIIDVTSATCKARYRDIFQAHFEA